MLFSRQCGCEIQYCFNCTKGKDSESRYYLPKICEICSGKSIVRLTWLDIMLILMYNQAIKKCCAVSIATPACLQVYECKLRKRWTLLQEDPPWLKSWLCGPSDCTNCEQEAPSALENIQPEYTNTRRNSRNLQTRAKKCQLLSWAQQFC